MTRGRRRVVRADPLEVSRWATLHVAMRRGRRVAEQQGHWLAAFEVDDPESVLECRISTCRKCGAIGAVDVEEEPWLFGPAFTRQCELRVDSQGQVVPGGAILVAR